MLAAAPAAAKESTLVICAPGFPATTEEAQDTMDAFAEAAAAAAGWKASDLAAVYFEKEQAGLDRLAEPEAAAAMVPLEFYLIHGETLGLRPFLQVVLDSGAEEVWSLVARKGAVTSPASLAGWELAGRAGYAPEVVRRIILAGWGELPADARITFTARPLSALRRAAAGEKVAVLLDSEQAGSLESLPFAADLEVVARSRPLPAVVLAVVDGRLDDAAAGQLKEGLLKLHRKKEGADLLRTMMLTRFQEVDRAALEELRGALSR